MRLAIKRTSSSLFVGLIIIAIVSIALTGCGWKNATAEREPNDPELVGAGDIATCGGHADDATADLLAGINGTVVTLGDNAYPRGSKANFAECYDPTWGRQELRTKPVPGNHEYYTAGAEGYFDYFGKAAGEPDEGYYSYDLGEWHIVALNSNCDAIGGCDDNSPQVRWLEDDLASHRKDCALAYFHYPLFSAGKYYPGIPEVKPLWEALYAAGADVVLNGHDHNYQRFAPQDPDGVADPNRGIREFVVGTGGAQLYKIDHTIENIEVYSDDVHGILKLTLHPASYEWRFVPVKGKTFTDSGSTRCH